MADNVAFTPGSGATGAADDIGGVLYPRVKLGLGADGSATDAIGGSGVVSNAVQRMSIATDDVWHGGVTEAAPATDTASSGLNGRLQRVAQRLTSLIALFPSAIGRTTSAGSLSTVIASDDAMVGIVTETAPASDTASSGLNGRLQRIAQRVTSLIALVPASLGQKTMANAFAVSIASDQSVIPAGGDVAHDGVDSGNPVKVGGIAKTSLPTAVADADRVNALHDKFGRQIMRSNLRELLGVQQTQISASTSETTIVTAVASTFLDLYGLILANTGATAVTVTIKDATAGTTRAKIYVPAGDTRGFMLPADAGIPQASSNNNWTATCSASTTAMEVTALYAKNT